MKGHKNMNNNKNILKITIIVLAIAIVVMGSALIATNIISNANEKKEIKLIENEISGIKEDFDSKSDRNEKLTILIELSNDLEIYLLEEKTNIAIIEKYQEEIRNMQKYFIDEIETTIKSNIIEDEIEITKENFDDFNFDDEISSLELLTSSIVREQNIIFENENEFKKYESDINDLLLFYKDMYNTVEGIKIQIEEEEAARIKALQESEAKAAEEARILKEKEEEEARIKAEADAKALQESEAKAAEEARNQQPETTVTYTPAPEPQISLQPIPEETYVPTPDPEPQPAPSGGHPIPPRRANEYYTTHWTYEPDGSIRPGSYNWRFSDGTVINEDGSEWNLNDWLVPMN